MNRSLLTTTAALLTASAVLIALDAAPAAAGAAEWVRVPTAVTTPEDPVDIVPLPDLESVVAVDRPQPADAQADNLTEAVAPDLPRPVAFPNPSSGVVTVRTQRTDVSVEVYDVNGRRIANLTAASGDASWDGRDGSGRSVTPGVYFARVSAPGAAAKTVRIVRK